MSKFLLPSTIDQVREFQAKFCPDQNSNHPALAPYRTALLRSHFIAEELGELIEAMAAGDLVEILDALIDLQYFLDGTFLAYGLDGVKELAFAEVHRSNMAKLGPDGEPILNAAGRVVKPEGWEPPELALVLGDYISQYWRPDDNV